MKTRAEIRAFVPEDQDVLVALWVAAWQETLPTIDFSMRRDFIARELAGAGNKGDEVLVACDPTGEPVGFFILRRQESEIDQFVVAPRLWGSGIAGDLLTRAREACPAGLSLIVNRDNPRAIWFYAREGFVVEDTSVNPNSGLPTLLMRWQPQESRPQESGPQES